MTNPSQTKDEGNAARPVAETVDVEKPVGSLLSRWAGAQSRWTLAGRERFEWYKRLARYHTLRIKALADFHADRVRSWLSRQLSKYTATLLSLIIVVVMLAFGDFGPNTKTSELSLVAAQIIGAALALILSLSIIPAQRASETFALPVLNMFANDRSLRFAFAVLVCTTLLSLLLGTSWAEQISGKVSLAIQFVLVGVSFDVLRGFYIATLKLLLPESAVSRLVIEIKRQLTAAERVANKVMAVQSAMVGNRRGSENVAHALAIQKARLPDALMYWSAQLEESAHRFISRRDSNATVGVVAALELIGRDYAELRKKSVHLHLDPSAIFAGPQSDIAQVLNPIFDSILRIIDDAVGAKNERIVISCVGALGRLAGHALSVVATTHYGVQVAPLAFNGVYYLDKAAKASLAANMLDATLHCVTALQSVLLNLPSGIDLTGVPETANDTLVQIAARSYSQENQVVVFKAVGAMLLSVKRSISNDFDVDVLKAVLDRLWLLLPAEISAERNGLRRVQTFPLYDRSFEASLPFLLQQIALKPFGPKRVTYDPFGDLSTGMEYVRDHYRKLSHIAFSDTLLHKWVIDSLSDVCRVLFNQIINPADGAHEYVGTVIRDLKNQISWMAGLFPEVETKHAHVRDATGCLTVLGIDALAHSQLEIADACLNALSDIASRVGPTSSWSLGDVHRDIEILARAAEAKLNNAFAAKARSKMVWPSSTPPDLGRAFTEAQSNRLHHLDRSLAEAGRRRHGIGVDPVEHLWRFTDAIRRETALK